MNSVPSWITSPGFGYSGAQITNVFIVVLRYLFEMVVCGVVSFQRKELLLLVNGLGFELLNREIKAAMNAFVQAAMGTAAIVLAHGVTTE